MDDAGSLLKAIGRAQAERPKVILVGLEFSGRNSASIISALKTEVATRDIPIFLICGENESPPWSESWVTRFDGVIHWPFGDEQIQALMRAGLRLGTMRVEFTTGAAKPYGVSAKRAAKSGAPKPPKGIRVSSWRAEKTTAATRPRKLKKVLLCWKRKAWGAIFSIA